MDTGNLILPLAVVDHLVWVLEREAKQRSGDPIRSETSFGRPVVHPLSENLVPIRPDGILEAGCPGLVRTDVQEPSPSWKRRHLIGRHNMRQRTHGRIVAEGDGGAPHYTHAMRPIALGLLSLALIACSGTPTVELDDFKRPNPIPAGASVDCTDIGPDKDLHGCDLSGQDLAEENLYNANLEGANLSGAKLKNADLRFANLNGANLSDADAHGANFGRASMIGAILFRADVHGADLHGADLTEVDGRALFGSRAQLFQTTLDRADFSGAQLDGANLYQSSMINTILRNANMRNAFLAGADITGADSSGAILEYAVMPDGSVRP